MSAVEAGSLRVQNGKEKIKEELLIISCFWHLFSKGTPCILVDEQHLPLAHQLQALRNWLCSHQLGVFNFFSLSLLVASPLLNICIPRSYGRKGSTGCIVCGMWCAEFASSRAIMQYEISIFNYILIYCLLRWSCSVACFYTRWKANIYFQPTAKQKETFAHHH